MASKQSNEIIQKKYTVKGKKINVAEIGSGKPILLVHGWSNSWIGWTLLAKKLAPHFKLYMVDMLGFGDSDENDEYSVDVQSRYIHHFLESQQIKPIAIMGASLGTIVGANVLKLYPKTTKNLILLGTIFSQLSIQRAKRLFHRILKLSNKTRPSQKIIETTVRSKYTAYIVERFLNAYKFDKTMVDKYNLPGRKKMKNKCYIDMGLSAYKFSMEEYLVSTKNNVLIIHGEAEKIVNTRQATKLLKEINNPKIKFKIIKKAGHNPAYEQPDHTAKTIREFLENSL